jgi:RNA polymerase sigma-54 factor
MSLPLQELRAKIQEELEKNPALEVVEDNSTVSLEAMTNKPEADFNAFEETSDLGYSKKQNDEASDEKRRFIEGTLSRPESLQDHLMWQLQLQPIPKELFAIGELLIHNLDNNGFHISSPEILLPQADKEDVTKVMKMIQKFDPLGVCTSNYQEALLVQIENHPHPHPLAALLVQEYLPLLEKGKTKEIEKKLKITTEELNSLLDFIKTLEPIPGRNFASEPPRYVIPDVVVRLKDGEFLLYLNDDEIPVLGISPFFVEISKEKGRQDEKQLNTFLATNLNNARWFIRSISQRNETLLKTCKVIVEFQRNFFRRGPKYLVPLTLKDIAREINVHEATVSRITTGKYIQTEWGIFELKYFFSNSISGSGSQGSRYSKQAVKEIIKDIILEEAGNHLSDIKIADILKSRGINIARRTVTKYRRELDINSSFER